MRFRTSLGASDPNDDANRKTPWNLSLNISPAWSRPLTRELMTRIFMGGPEMVRVLASIEIEVPSEHIPSRLEAELMPFGKAFFLEAAPDWTGSLDLKNAEAMKIVES